jgi:hypothetical protein
VKLTNLAAELGAQAVVRGLRAMRGQVTKRQHKRLLASLVREGLKTAAITAAGIGVTKLLEKFAGKQARGTRGASGNRVISLWPVFIAFTLVAPAALHAQGQVCMDGTRPGGDGTACVQHGGVDYIATNTGASALAGGAPDTARNAICVDGSKTSLGLPACPSQGSVDTAAARAASAAPNTRADTSRARKSPTSNTRDTIKVRRDSI